METVSVKHFRGKAILFATILASGMAFLDGSVVTIAAPAMQVHLQATLTDIQWIMNGYTLMLSSLLLIAGSLGDRFGRKKIFLYGIVVFTLASLLCSFSKTAAQLIGFRIVEGVGAAFMVPGSLSIIDVSFDQSVRGKAIGLWSGFAGGIAALGPLAGGWLVQTFGWPSIFYINIPFGIVALLVTYRYIEESKNHTTSHTDWFGAFTIFLSLAGISYGLIYAPTKGWLDWQVLGSIVGGILLALVFITIEKKVKEPLFPFRIFTSRLVTGANLATLFLYFALSGVIFFLVLNFQQLQHFPPLISGLGLLPPVILITFLSGPAGGLADKIGSRIPMIIGPLLVSIGMATFLFPGAQANYFIDFFPGLMLFGVGMSLVIAPLTKSALAVQKHFSGVASGINNAVARVAGLFAVAVLGAIILSVFSIRLQATLSTLPFSSDKRMSILMQTNKLESITIPTEFSHTEKMVVTESIDDAFLLGFRWVIGISAFLAFLSSITSYFMIKE